MVGRDFHPAYARTHRSLPRCSRAYIQACVSVHARVYDQHGGSYVHGTVHGGRSRIYRVEWSTPGSVDQWLTASTDTAAAGSRDDPGSGAWSMTWTMTSRWPTNDHRHSSALVCDPLLVHCEAGTRLSDRHGDVSSSTTMQNRYIVDCATTSVMMRCRFFNVVRVRWRVEVSNGVFRLED